MAVQHGAQNNNPAPNGAQGLSRGSFRGARGSFENTSPQYECKAELITISTLANPYVITDLASVLGTALLAARI